MNAFDEDIFDRFPAHKADLKLSFSHRAHFVSARKLLQKFVNKTPKLNTRTGKSASSTFLLQVQKLFGKWKKIGDCA